MATIEHEALVDLFRRDPALIARLLVEVFAAALPAFARAEVVDTSLVQLVPTEFRADLVIELRDEVGRAVLVIILEPQRDEDPRKRFSWPVYLAAARARSRCPACLVVIAPDRAVARWARQPIDLGLGRANVAPIVFGPDEVPMIDENEARANVELAVLSVVVHGDDAAVLSAARGAMRALAEVPDAAHGDYLYVIMNALRAPLREALEEWIMARDETDEEYVARLRPLLPRVIARVEAEVRAEAKARAKAEGTAEGMARALLHVFAARNLEVTEPQRERIERCTDLVTLERWLESAVTAVSVDDALR